MHAITTIEAMTAMLAPATTPAGTPVSSTFWLGAGADAVATTAAGENGRSPGARYSTVPSSLSTTYMCSCFRNANFYNRYVAQSRAGKCLSDM
jgi:hypothetical protein